MALLPILGVAGALLGAASTARAGRAAAAEARENARLRAEQAEHEKRLNTMQDLRERRDFATQIRQQASELVGRGVSLDSPTAIYLAQAAGAELAFQSQAIRSGGAAALAELNAQSRAYQAQARNARVTGNLSAASDLLTDIPKIWSALT